MTGRVASVRDFGAFVDLGGGVQGLLHVSEMGWSRVDDVSKAFKAGDEITVKVLRVDDDKQKISLGLKQLSEDPWSRVPSTYEVGQVRSGRVTRLAEFGAFVELEPGIEGWRTRRRFPRIGRETGPARLPSGRPARSRSRASTSRESGSAWRRCLKGRRAPRGCATMARPNRLRPRKDSDPHSATSFEAR
jgi:predicted RNA-binding protein with RPS1 domain